MKNLENEKKDEIVYTGTMHDSHWADDTACHRFDVRMYKARRTAREYNGYDRPDSVRHGRADIGRNNRHRDCATDNTSAGAGVSAHGGPKRRPAAPLDV